PMPEAQALRRLLVEAAARASKHMEAVPDLANAHRFLERYMEGKTVSEIARDLGVSREWCSRTFRRQALEMASMQFVRLVSEEGRDQEI
ncbi:MAG: helix-turn-helix domain-containing protein, partial [Chloroflexota bacterium]